MSRAYEVRDVQYLLGLLADEGVIDPQAIAATGQSEGAGMSLRLGALKDRVEPPDHELVLWTARSGTPMSIAAIAPQAGWTDLAQAEWPNRSELDHVSYSPHNGIAGENRVGIEKQSYQQGQLELAEAARISATTPARARTPGRPKKANPLA
jgi:hypothetical protein